MRETLFFARFLVVRCVATAAEVLMVTRTGGTEEAYDAFRSGISPQYCVLLRALYLPFPCSTPLDLHSCLLCHCFRLAVDHS